MGKHLERGHALFDLNRYREAVEAFQAELSENPGNAVAHAVLAAALINLGKVREADKAIRQSLQLAPDLAYAHYILSFVHQSYRRLGDAENAIVEAVRLEHDPQNFHQWAVIAELRGKFGDALAATAQALRLNPRHNPSILLRGKLLAREGKMEEAHSLYMAALLHNPEDAAAQHALGSLQLRTGNVGRALGTLREARRLDPISANDAAAIALAYGRMVWPFSMIDRVVFRWHLLPPKKRWLLFTVLAALLVICGNLAGSSLEDINPHPAWAGACIALSNYFVLPFSFDRLAGTVGYFALRREFRPRWYTLLIRPIVLLPAVWMHLGALFLGVMLSVPGLAVALCLGGATAPLLMGSIQTTATRLTGWLCLPLFFLLMIFGTMGGVVLDLESDLVGLMLLVPVFAIAYFSDNMVRWTASWGFHRYQHIIDLV